MRCLLCKSNSDFIILFADDDRIYAKHGYQRADNPAGG